ncbi:AMP-binding protein [Streptomyces sp. SID3343]|uniref:AMP-binding protein n=1 Tax=Streptomyces sp. SID3343 TaxID=2690260 RepID=UPI0031FA25F2
MPSIVRAPDDTVTAAGTVPALLAARVSTEPGKTAILVPGAADDRLTFAAWAERADTLAHGLRARGVGAGECVALCFSGAEWIDYAVAYCAVQQIGAVAVPIPERLAPITTGAILAHCAAVGVVHGAWIELPAGPAWSAQPHELVGHGPAFGPDTAPARRTGPQADDLAQILYTSGTTGTPKGVAATHANLTFGLEPAPRRRPLAHSRHFLHAFPIGTNAGQTMLLTALSAAPTAICVPTFEAEQFCALIAEYRVGTAFVVPAMAGELVRSGATTRHDVGDLLLLGSTAAALPPATAVALTAAFPHATIVNSYTSTEAAPAQTTMVFDPDRPSSVGRSVLGDDLRVLTEDGDPLPIGVPGEIWLRSPTTPRAYHRDEAASTKVFRDGWVRMGDLGRLDAEGYLYVIDRESDLVTSGAFKISTLAVEAALYEHPAVVEAAAFGVPHAAMGAMPAAAVVLDPGTSPDDLRDFLRSRLAREEIPTRFLVLDTLPRNAAGKVVKTELRALLATVAAPAHATAPSTPTEVTLSRLWAEVLEIAPPGPNDEFFVLGGDSFKATRLAALAGHTFAIDVPTSLPFDLPRLGAQAEWIEAAPQSAERTAGRTTAEAAEGAAEGAAEEAARQGTPAREPTSPASAFGPEQPGTGTGPAPDPGPSPDPGPGPGPGPESDRVPLSSQQENFFVWMYATDEPRDVGPVSAAIRITDTFDPDVFHDALAEIVHRHEALRTVFRRSRGNTNGESEGEANGQTNGETNARTNGTSDGETLAFVLAKLPPEVVRVRAEGATAAEREEFAHRYARVDRERYWDLEHGPLVRALLIELDAEDHVLVLAVHHLVFDGWSMGILLRELALVYSAFRSGRANPLAPLALTCSQQVTQARAQWPRTRRFWTETLAGAPAHTVPFPGRAHTTRLHSGAVRFTLGADVVERLRALARAWSATPFMLATACWTDVLATHSGVRDIVVMSPVPGRSQPGSEAIVGCLVQSLLIRVDLSGSPRPDELLARVRSAALAASEHQSYPFAEFYPRFPDAAWVRYESWTNRAHFLGLLSEPFELPRELDAEWPTPGGLPDLGVPELALSEKPDGSIDGWLLYNACAFEQADVEALGQSFVTNCVRTLDHLDEAVPGPVPAVLVSAPTSVES